MKRPMTRDEATTKAKRLWPTCFVTENWIGEYPNARRICKVGTVAYGIFWAKGEGVNWEEAFEDAARKSTVSGEKA